MVVSSKQYLSLGEVSKHCSLAVETLTACLMRQAHPSSHYRLPGKILLSLDDIEARMQCYQQALNCPLNLDHEVNQLANDILTDLE